MHKSKLPLTVWFWAAWLLVSSKGGISALELSRQFGVSEETAFTLLHKLRHAMVAPDREKLKGVVEVDETYLGAKGHKGDKIVVVGAVEVRGRRPARIRLRMIGSPTKSALGDFLRDHIEPGSTIVTDGNPSYAWIHGYKHVPQVNNKDVPTGENLPYFHTAISNLKAWLRGTHHGAVRPQHLQAYLNEFAFRYNRRDNLGAAFARLLELAPSVGKLSYESLYDPVMRHKNPHFAKVRAKR